MIKYIIDNYAENKMTYNKAVALLYEAGIENAETDAAILFEHFAGVARHTLPFRRDEEIECVSLMSALGRRLSREPLQYVIGKWDFFGLPFTLNTDCLCPRPDTELIVELALKNLPKNAHFCDIGTGSGAIAVAVAHYRKDTTAEAFDINENALSAASRNAEINGVADRVKFTKSDALAEDFLDGKVFDAILSNPPYIPADVIPTLAPEVLLEPHRALDGGNDGLVFYSAITRKAATVLRDGGFILYEVGIGQANDVSEIGKENGFSSEIFSDLGGIDRAVLLRKI